MSLIIDSIDGQNFNKSVNDVTHLRPKHEAFVTQYELRPFDHNKEEFCLYGRVMNKTSIRALSTKDGLA